MLSTTLHGILLALKPLLESLWQKGFATVLEDAQRKLNTQVRKWQMEKAHNVPGSLFHHPSRLASDLDSFKSVYNIRRCLCLLNVDEPVNDGDLHSYVSQHGGLFDEDPRNIAKMFFPAITAFHAKKIVHHDPKPGSILISRGINPVVKIADFGLAKMVQ
ncbi:hypothetical protein BT69DRAFT_1371645 [Atractiella rhizophila]|nr:hypothetical protein BT69DRAFT_1371645 [Atractiella rhizophila]